MEIYTIGFTKKSAEQFFGLLGRNDIERLVDIRLNNTSQLAGFTKGPDLAYFLGRILDAEYKHEPQLAPAERTLKKYREDKLWDEYEPEFIATLESRRVQDLLDPTAFENKRTVLLCSEPTAEMCHRRLVVEYLSRHWTDVRRVDL